MKYRVQYNRAVWETITVIVEAQDADRATDRALSGEGEQIDYDVGDSVADVADEVVSVEATT